MLITKEVEVKLVPSNIKYYQNLGYKGKMGDLIIVKIEDLSNGSHVLVEVECDYCHEHFSTPYSSYILSIKYIDKNSCKNSVCKNKKTKETTLLRYGVDNTSKLQSMQEKMCNTNIRKYGVPYYMQTTELQKNL